MHCKKFPTDIMSQNDLYQKVKQYLPHQHHLGVKDQVTFTQTRRSDDVELIYSNVETV